MAGNVTGEGNKGALNPFRDCILSDPERLAQVSIPEIHHAEFQQLQELLEEGLIRGQNREQAALVVSSHPGSGKTHLLSRLIVAFQGRAYPVFLPPILRGSMEAAILNRLVQRLWNYTAEQQHRNRFEWLALELLALADSENPENASGWRKALANLGSPEVQTHLRQYEGAITEALARFLQKNNLGEAFSWARALMDILTNDLEREERATLWMRGELEPYRPGASGDERLPEEPERVVARATDRLLGLLHLFGLVRPIILFCDQVENYVASEQGAVLRFLVCLQTILQQSPRTQVVVAGNVANWETLLPEEAPLSFRDRFSPIVVLRGLSLSQASTLRDARARLSGEESVQKAGKWIPDEAVRTKLGIGATGKPSVEVTPRAFLMWCAERWEGRFEETAPEELSREASWEEEWKRTLGRVEREGVGFFAEAIETVYHEVFGGEVVEHKGYRWIQGPDWLVTAEDSVHWKRWEARCGRLSDSKVIPDRMLILRPGRELAEDMHVRWCRIPGDGWRSDHLLRRLLGEQAHLWELDSERMCSLLAASRFLDAAADLQATRSDLAVWLRKTGKLKAVAWPQLPSPQQAESVTVSQPPPTNSVAVLTVSDLLKMVARTDTQMRVLVQLEPRQRGLYFHELAARLVSRLRKAGREGSAEETAHQMLRSDSLVLSLHDHDQDAPRASEGLMAMAARLDSLRRKSGGIGWDEMLLHTEQQLFRELGVFDGVTLALSGRCDLLRRRADGSLEVVDYKLGLRDESGEQLIQLALYARLLSRGPDPIRCGGCLEVYHPEVTVTSWTAEELEQVFSEDIEPALMRLVREARKSNPALTRVKLALEGVAEADSPATPDKAQEATIQPWDQAGTGRESSQKETPVAVDRPSIPPGLTPAWTRACQAFAGFVGNDEVVDRLQTALADAISRGDPPICATSFLFTGPGGLGKTELALRVARALGHPLVQIQGSRIRRLDDLVELMDAALLAHNSGPREAGLDSGLPKWVYPSLVLFIDEVHELGRLTDQLLGLFEPRERRAVAADRVIHLPHATFLAATTDKFRLPKPFLTRFRELPLRAYTADQVAEMLRLAGVPGDQLFRKSLALASRLNPRVAKSHAEEFASYHRQRGITYDAAGLALMRTQWKVEADGLDERDLDYLRLLKDGPQSLRTLAQRLGYAEAVIAEEVEPFLQQQGLIEVTAKGRQLSLKGRDRLPDQSVGGTGRIS